MIGFTHTTDPECAKIHGIKAPGFALFRNFDEDDRSKSLPYQGENTHEGLQKWVNANMLEVNKPFSNLLINLMEKRHQPYAILFRSQDDKYEDYLRVYDDAIQKYSGMLHFFHADAGGSEFE